MLQRCFLLGLFAVQSISQEHGGDEFKNWPERPGAWVQQTRNIVFFICSGRRLYKYNEDDIFYKALIPYKHISNYKLTSYDEDGIKEFSLFILKLLI